MSESNIPDQISGREPRLSNKHSTHGARRLSLRGLATLLHALPPEQISLEVAEAALRNEDFYVRYHAAQMLSKRADRDARLIMSAVLADGEVPSRASVARHLGAFSWFSAEPLLRQALADPDLCVREGAIYALCDMRDLQAFRLLAETLDSAPDLLRAAAAYGLRDCQDSAAVPALAAALRATDPDVRAATLEALGANGSADAVPLVRGALNDPEPDVQYAAALTLLELIGENGLAELAAAIRAAQGAACAALLRGLFHATNYLGIEIADDDASDAILDAIEESLHDSAPEVRRAAVWLAAWMRHPRAEALLEAAYYGETEPEVKAHALHVAVNLMVEQSEAFLSDGLTSDLIEVREVATHIVNNRSSGTVARYDKDDKARHGLSLPHMGDDDWSDVDIHFTSLDG